MRFLFIHGWDGFSLAEWCLRQAVGERCVQKVDFRGMALKSGDLERQQAFFREIALFHPDYIGFSCNFWNHEYYLQMASCVKALVPECIIILGGPHVNSLKSCELALSETPAIDYIIRGYAERSLPALLNARSRGHSHDSVSGLSFRSNNRVIQRPVNVRQKWKRHRLFTADNEELTDLLSSQQVVSYETLRGCRFACAYCQYPQGGEDLLDLDMVLDELQYLCTLEVPHIRICDAFFGGTRARAIAILSMLAKVNKHSSVKIYPSLLHIDDEYLDLAKSAGAEITSIGIQTTQKKVLKKIRRPEIHRLQTPIDRVLKKFPRTPADLIVGLPEDTPETLQTTIIDVLNMGFSCLNMFRLAAYPGTPMTEDMDKMFENPVLCKPGEQVMISGHFPKTTHEEVSRLLQAAEIVACLSEVKARMAGMLTIESLLHFLLAQKSDVIDRLHAVVFDLPAQAFIRSLAWICDNFMRAPGWGIHCEEAMIEDLMLQQYRKCISRDIDCLVISVNQTIFRYENVVYRFRNGRYLLWRLAERDFITNPDNQILTAVDRNRCWVIDPIEVRRDKAAAT